MCRKPGRMSKIGDKTKERTDQELADQELELLQQTTIDWEALHPKMQDQETYDKLRSIVQDSNVRNENLMQLKIRLQTLGKDGLDLTKKIINIIKKV